MYSNHLRTLNIRQFKKTKSLIAGSYLSIWDFSVLLKSTLAVLQRCPGTSSVTSTPSNMGTKHGEAFISWHGEFILSFSSIYVCVVLNLDIKIKQPDLDSRFVH